jgi:hypothetical protein
MHTQTQYSHSISAFTQLNIHHHHHHTGHGQNLKTPFMILPQLCRVKKLKFIDEDVYAWEKHFMKSNKKLFLRLHAMMMMINWMMYAQSGNGLDDDDTNKLNLVYGDDETLGFILMIILYL